MSAIRNFDENISNGSIHGTIVPADVRDGDPVFAKLICRDPKFHFNTNLRVWKLSPLGIELLNESDSSVPKGLPVDLELFIGNQKSMLSGLVVDDVVVQKGKHLLHIRLTTMSAERSLGADRRHASRWICSDQFYPTAVASNPAKFNDFIYFKVRDISKTGFKLTTSLRNKFIVPGMTFDCLINFPMVSQVNMKVEIKNVRVELENGKEVLALGANFVTDDKVIKQTVAQYLMQFGSVNSLEELKDNGLEVITVADAVQYSYVKTKEEYEQVLKLRFHAYQAAGKLRSGAAVADMADEYDSRARIVIGTYKGEVVASARLIFNHFDDKMEQEKFVEWPAHLPRRDEMVEIMRACTRPDFRGSDLLMGMFKFIAVAVCQSHRKWIVMCSVDDLVPMYERIGYSHTGLSYAHQGLNGLKHNIMLAYVPDAMLGRTVDFISWNIVWSGVSQYLQQYDMINSDPAANLRLGIYRLLAPLAEFIYNWKKTKSPRMKTYPKGASKQEASALSIPKKEAS